AHEGARPARRPRRTGGTSMTVQLPPLKSPSGTGPHAVPPDDALSSAGGLRHTALGGGDRAPWRTSTNGGNPRAAPPRNLGIRTGQRPTIHRLHQCRGPKGPVGLRSPQGTGHTRHQPLSPRLWWATAPVPAAVAPHGTNVPTVAARQPAWQGRRQNPEGL